MIETLNRSTSRSLKQAVMKQIKVLHFYKTYLPDTIGGVEQVINQIACSTANLGVTAEVMSLSPVNVPSTVDVDGHKVHRCRSVVEVASTPLSFTALFRFRQLAKEADIIHYHFPYPFADLLHFLCFIKKPVVVTYHSDIIKQKLLLKFYRHLKRRFLNSVDAIVVGSPNYLASSAVLSRYKSKVSIVPYGLDKSNYAVPEPEDTAKWEKRFGDRFFLFLGVLRYYKGLHILIESAKGSDYPIVIVGAGPIEKELKRKAELSGVKNIHFVGFVEDVDKVALLQLAYAVVFPSHLRSEAFGISLLEGAMYGKPLISSEIGTGTTYINIDKETGVVVPPSDPLALRKAMDYLWNNPEVAARMGRNAEARYREIFTADKMAESYVSLYENLLSAH